MHKIAFNPALIRALLIVLFLVITQILRASKRSKTANPTARPAAATGSPLSDALCEARQQRADQARARQSERPADGVLLQMSEPFQQPPKIEPQSSFVPSLLLLALLVCLCLMAYRYWAR
jgi:hypothetical protein